MLIRKSPTCRPDFLPSPRLKNRQPSDGACLNPTPSRVSAFAEWKSQAFGSPFKRRKSSQACPRNILLFLCFAWRVPCRPLLPGVPDRRLQSNHQTQPRDPRIRCQHLQSLEKRNRRRSRVEVFYRVLRRWCRGIFHFFNCFFMVFLSFLLFILNFLLLLLYLYF